MQRSNARNDQRNKRGERQFEKKRGGGGKKCPFGPMKTGDKYPRGKNRLFEGR